MVANCRIIATACRTDTLPHQSFSITFALILQASFGERRLAETFHNDQAGDVLVIAEGDLGSVTGYGDGIN